MIFKRTLEKILLIRSTQLPVVAIVGPRQSGKTTLSKTLFRKHNYVSLEDLDVRTFAKEDPRKFFKEYVNEFGIIIDEIQHVPDLLSYIQTMVDTDDRPGRFIVTGSQNFLLQESISQTLAGRVSLCTLLPLSITEMRENNIDLSSLESFLFQGQYPRIYGKMVEPVSWYKDYVSTYLEKDVRQVKNILDLTRFMYFVKLCAGRVGQILNVQSLATDAGIDSRTAKSWLSLLESSYIIHLLHPYYKNFSKRIIKSPKIYFYDTGILCSLLGIETGEQLQTHYARGNIFESAMMAELFKYFFNQNRKPNMYFWQDHHGNRIDCLIEQGQMLVPIEIKSSMTISPHFFKNLMTFNDVVEKSLIKRNFIIYAGDKNQSRSVADVLRWNELDALYKELEL